MALRSLRKTFLGWKTNKNFLKDLHLRGAEKEFIIYISEGISEIGVIK
jgi:hypothetical protein